MLAEVQAELEARFTALARLRQPHGYPVYALEHGIDAGRIDALAEAASRSLQINGPRDQHWLVWAALAAEAGYRYTGDEYWPALEWRPNEWRGNEQRQWLRRRFKRFRDRFGGPEPVGRWAEHFSIIAWPIANAILPKYLQAHFASQLHAQRWLLADRVGNENADLGHVLLEGYDGSSSRFADFLQQTELTSQIVRALRDSDIGAESLRILPAVLERILSDLEERQVSGALLRAARSVISTHRVSVASDLRRAAGNPSAGNDTQSAVSRIAIAARRIADGSVLLGVIFPDIGATMTLAGIEPNKLTDAQIRTIGESDRTEPALALLGLSRRDRPLECFPTAGQPIIELLASDSALRAIIQPLFSLPDAPLWLLRRHADGVYREVRGRHVRTSESYLVLSRQALEQRAAERAVLLQCPTSAKAVHVYALETPALLAVEQRTALAALGIGTVTGIRIDPLGLAPVSREVDGLPQWTASETILLRLTADFDLAAFSIAVDGEPASHLRAEAGALMIALNPLGIGEHSLSIRAANGSGTDLREIGDAAEFDFVVVPPRPWQETMRDKAGFRLLLGPKGSELEDLFAHRAEACVYGPVGRTVAWSLETFDATGHLTCTIEGGSSPVGSALPLTVLNRLRQDRPEEIDAAHRVDLVASLGELGRQALAFPHLVEPLRWRFDSAKRRVRLIDETSHEHPVIVRHYSLATPLTKTIIGNDEAVIGIDLAPPGALLIAKSGRHQCAIFASILATDRLHGFADLGFDQDFALERHDRDAVLQLLTGISRWRRARPVGSQAFVRKEITLERLTSELAARASGRDFAAHISRADGLVPAQPQVGGSPGFGLLMRTFNAPENKADGLREFREIARRYGIEVDEGRIADAYRLAFFPSEPRFGDLASARARIAALLNNRALVRGAFLAAAAVRFGKAGRLEVAV